MSPDLDPCPQEAAVSPASTHEIKGSTGAILHPDQSGDLLSLYVWKDSLICIQDVRLNTNIKKKRKPKTKTEVKQPTKSQAMRSTKVEESSEPLL